MQTFIGILALIWSVLCLVLFFKIWKMTNNVNEILLILQESHKSDKMEETPTLLGDIPSNSLVVEIATGKQMRVKSVSSDGKYSCYINQGATHYGDFSRNEFVLFDEYVKSKK